MDFLNPAIVFALDAHLFHDNLPVNDRPQF